MINKIKEYQEEVAQKYDKILLGVYPEVGFMINYAKPVRDMLDLSGMDEVTILKATIIEYHRMASNLMQLRINAEMNNRPFWVKDETT